MREKRSFCSGQAELWGISCLLGDLLEPVGEVVSEVEHSSSVYYPVIYPEATSDVLRIFRCVNIRILESCVRTKSKIILAALHL